MGECSLYYQMIQSLSGDFSKALCCPQEVDIHVHVCSGLCVLLHMAAKKNNLKKKRVRHY